MASFNKVVLIGNLTRDPEKRQLPSGQAVTRLGLAVNRQYKNRQTGQMVQEVCFIDVDVWGVQAESAHQYLAKGRMALVEGRLKLDSWQDQSGQTRTKHSIVAERVVFLGGNQATTETEAGLEAEDFGGGANEELEAKKSVTRGARKTASTKETVKTDFEFKDTPAFEDELPF
ncbi:MAG: Single-stranded DNA-binding protein [candidate division TM6 bacterium GW2011_GWE2_41_16]|nr:MAG: Single-stranded DNA-binding protein [candidate division TM6 bacterium GW2011_GWE2_41_16]